MYTNAEKKELADLRALNQSALTETQKARVAALEKEETAENK